MGWGSRSLKTREGEGSARAAGHSTPSTERAVLGAVTGEGSQEQAARPGAVSPVPVPDTYTTQPSRGAEHWHLDLGAQSTGGDSRTPPVPPDSTGASLGLKKKKF